MLKFTLQQGHSISTLVWVTALAVVLVTLFYWRAFRKLKPRQWQILLALRILAILTIGLLLFRPVLSYYKELSEQRSVVFLVDTSSSMGISDDSSGKSRIEQAREQVGGWVEQLEDAFALHVIEFSERPRLLPDAKQLPTLTAEGKATSISRALAYLGLSTVKSLVLGFSLVDITRTAGSGFDLTAYWRRYHAPGHERLLCQGEGDQCDI